MISGGPEIRIRIIFFKKLKKHVKILNFLTFNWSGGFVFSVFVYEVCVCAHVCAGGDVTHKKT